MSLSTAENPSPFDPLDEMPPDEPRFLIRGRDRQGPPTITEWARLTRNAAIKQYGTDPRSQRDKRALEAVLLKCAAADDDAAEMAEWQRGNLKADEQRASYSGIQQTEEQIAALREHRRLEALLRAIQEGRFYLSEARDGLLELGRITQQQADEVQGWLDSAQQIADANDPRIDYAEPKLPVEDAGG